MRVLLHLDGDPEALVDALVPSGTELRHAFVPHGLSVVRIAPDATVALHTWPEHGRATLDCYGTAARRAPGVLDALGWTVLHPPPEDGWNSFPT